MIIESNHCRSRDYASSSHDIAFTCDKMSQQLMGKYIIDLASASLLLAVAWPMIVLLMALVRLTSRGPALYSQVRLGLDGRPFTIYKLRTMFHDCERLTGPRWCATGDSRVTRLGRFLRVSHLDELPQLWNVLRGEMSLVGPRPERPEFVRQLERVIPNYRERLRVLPGITGLAQIQLPPDEDVSGVSDKVAYDVYYVHRSNAWLDLRIVAGTGMKVLGVPFQTIRTMLQLPSLDSATGFVRAPEVGEKSIPQILEVAS